MTSKGYTGRSPATNSAAPGEAGGKLIVMLRPVAVVALIAGLAMAVGTGCVDLSRPIVRVTDGPAPGRDGGSDGPRDAPVDVMPSETSLDVGEDPDGDPPEVLLLDAPLETAPPDAAPAANGSPCDNAGQCLTGNCVSGICCDSGCTGSCQSCIVAGKVGLCSPVPAGEDPGNHCEQDPESTCKRDGTCDGAGSCRTYGMGIICTPGSCTAGVQTAAGTCNGQGTCIAGATQSCAPNVCIGATCGQACTADNQCAAGSFCDANKCVQKKAAAAPCNGNNQCASSFCVDGVCCDSACGTMCFACNVAGKIGTCTAAPAGQDPRNQCPAEAQTSCGRAGGCNGSGACRQWPAGTVCAPGSCTSGSEIAPRQCNGGGTCLAGPTRDCSPYVCGAGACATTCSSSADCQIGRPCAGGKCAAIPDLTLFWRFEELGGATAIDSSANMLNGAYVGSVGLPAPSSAVPPLQYTNARSRSFTLANQHAVRLAPLPAVLRPTAAITMALWYRATSVAGDGAELVSGGNAYTLRLGPTQIEVSKRTSGAFVDCRATVPGYLDGNWHHVVGVISPTGFTIYFDGTSRASCGQTQPINYSVAGPDFWVGRHGDNQGYHFGGEIDEVRIYTRALNSAEIAALGAGGH